ncbi:MAG: hypothetical protein JWL72_650 [Ilumatobacteraceae bacterium]|nr:hypothetical protein [Ilumatobacteraceae bacterium]
MSITAVTRGFTVAAILCAGCASTSTKSAPDGAPSASTPSTPAPSTPPAPATPPGSDEAPDGGGAVQVRFVNLYAPSDHPAGVGLNGFFQGDTYLNSTDGSGTPNFSDIAYGQTSGYKSADPSKVGQLELFVSGQPQAISSVNIDGSATGRYTFVVYDIGQPGFAAVEGFNETPSASDVAQKFPGALSAAPDGKALIVAVGGPLQTITDQKGFTLGQPGKGCFALQVPDPPNSGQSLIPSGGSLNFVADPGPLQIAYFGSDDTDCSQSPVIAPVAVTLAAGDRTYVVAYGTAGSPELLSIDVPIAALAGDQPLIPSPTAVTETPSSDVDPCSVLTDDQAATALGAPVDNSTGDTTSGACTYTAGAATLFVSIQTGVDTAAFDAIKSGASNGQPAEGIGDDAFFTTDPDSIVAIKGTTMLAIGLDRHADSGPDDPAIDDPIIAALATAALQQL